MVTTVGCRAPPVSPNDALATRARCLSAHGVRTVEPRHRGAAVPQHKDGRVAHQSSLHQTRATRRRRHSSPGPCGACVSATKGSAATTEAGEPLTAVALAQSSPHLPALVQRAAGILRGGLHARGRRVAEWPAWSVAEAGPRRHAAAATEPGQRLSHPPTSSQSPALTSLRRLLAFCQLAE
jgi:hypothetical protein